MFNKLRKANQAANHVEDNWESYKIGAICFVAGAFFSAIFIKRQGVVVNVNLIKEKPNVR